MPSRDRRGCGAAGDAPAPPEGVVIPHGIEQFNTWSIRRAAKRLVRSQSQGLRDVTDATLVHTTSLARLLTSGFSPSCLAVSDGPQRRGPRIRRAAIGSSGRLAGTMPSMRAPGLAGLRFRNRSTGWPGIRTRWVWNYAGEHGTARKPPSWATLRKEDGTPRSSFRLRPASRKVWTWPRQPSGQAR